MKLQSAMYIYYSTW